VEIIVVDGGSQDATLRLVPPDVKVIHSKPNRGKQMNLGAEHSTGRYWYFAMPTLYCPKDGGQL